MSERFYEIFEWVATVIICLEMCAFAWVLGKMGTDTYDDEEPKKKKAP